MRHNLLTAYPIISDQVDERELTIILQELTHALQHDASISIVEFGCYIGTTSLFVRRIMDQLGASGSFHVYDSFAGLPEKSSHDTSPAGTQFRPGELLASKRDFVRQFKKASLRLPTIHKNWFDQLSPDDIPGRIGFAFLDGDYYESIRDSLRLITPQLVPGAIIVVDDYVSDALPGAARAVDEWRSVHAHRLRVERGLAIMHMA